MGEIDDIKNLQIELDLLNSQLKEQQLKINDLQQRIIQLGNEGNPIPFSPERKALHKQAWSVENFIGLRLIHFIGIIVLVIGLSIGVKYAIDRELVSEVMRISLAYGAGIILFGLSLRLRRKYDLFSAILFSGAMASLYFTTYAAYVYYDLISFGISYVVMIALAIYTIYEAIEYNHQEIALLALVGAYGIPFLISRNTDRADLFFLYISLINIAVVFLCVRKEWKQVGRVANGITWLLFIGWASIRFNLKLQWLGFVFMAFFFLLFLFSVFSLKFFHKRKFTTNDYYQILVNNLALGVAALFVFGYSFANADIAMLTLILAVFAALQSVYIHVTWPEESLLVKMLASLAFILFVLFIAFNWNGVTVTFLWLLIAVLVFILGVVMKSVPARMASIYLMGVTLFKLIVFDSLTFTTIQKIISYIALGILLLVVSFFYQKFKEQLFDKGK
jgi:uncharacterized membrane protein